MQHQRPLQWQQVHCFGRLAQVLPAQAVGGLVEWVLI